MKIVQREAEKKMHGRKMAIKVKKVFIDGGKPSLPSLLHVFTLCLAVYLYYLCGNCIVYTILLINQCIVF
jgi:hypothetical protein